MPRLFCTSVFLACLAFGAMAQAQTPQSRAIGVKAATPAAEKPKGVYRQQHALCIGINDYQSETIPDLSYSEADAQSMSDLFRDVYKFDHVKLLLGAQATKAAIVGEIAALMDPGIVSHEDGVVIFFSGHGQTVDTGIGDSKQGYLLPVDAQVTLGDVSNPRPFRQYAIRMDNLKTDADDIPALHVIFLVDACYSGFMASRALSTPDVDNALKYPARQVITAGSQGEQVIEHNSWGHGAFTYKLLQRLSIETEPVFATELGSWLKKYVPREVQAKVGDQYTLSPQAKYLSGEGDYVFLRPGQSLAAAPTPTPASTPIVAAPPPAVNHPPKVEAVFFDPEVATSGGDITMTIMASDPDGDSISVYSYAVGGGEMKMSPKAEIKITGLGASGVREVEVQVKDSKGLDSSPFASRFMVKAAAPKPVAVSTPRPSVNTGASDRDAANSARQAALNVHVAGIDIKKNQHFLSGEAAMNRGDYVAAKNHFLSAKRYLDGLKSSGGGFSIQ